MMGGFTAVTVRTPVTFANELARLRGGDLDAIGALMSAYQHRLYRYLLRIVRQPATAEDLFQQTWLRVMERISSYDPQRNFEGWLFSLAHNLAIDHLRKVRPESLDEPLPSGETFAAVLEGADPGGLEMVLARERAGLLAEMLQEIPVVFREVITLRFEEDMKLQEIADVLGVPLPTVKTRLHRGLLSLRRLLTDKLAVRN
jgi:RNA polymerase sigma-70 factor (ECF subfamily)